LNTNNTDSINIYGASAKDKAELSGGHTVVMHKDEAFTMLKGTNT
jgi:hypothetical protein